MTWKNTKLTSNLKKLLKKHSDVKDIYVFGSTVREKRDPNDTDILVLFKTKEDTEVAHSIRKEVEKFYPDVSTTTKTEKDVLDPSFRARESLLFEARSLISGKNLAQEHGFSSAGMFRYDFKDWTKLQKTKFYHAFNGRNGNGGISQSLDCIKLADNVVLVPLNHIDEFDEFLSSWKLSFIYSPVMIPERMNKKRILERR